MLRTTQHLPRSAAAYACLMQGVVLLGLAMLVPTAPAAPQQGHVRPPIVALY